MGGMAYIFKSLDSKIKINFVKNSSLLFNERTLKLGIASGDLLSFYATIDSGKNQHNLWILWQLVLILNSQRRVLNRFPGFLQKSIYDVHQ